MSAAEMSCIRAMPPEIRFIAGSTTGSTKAKNLNNLVSFIREPFQDFQILVKSKKKVLVTQVKAAPCSMTVLGGLQSTRQKKAMAEGNNEVVKTISVMSCRVLQKVIWI